MLVVCLLFQWQLAEAMVKLLQLNQHRRKWQHRDRISMQVGSVLTSPQPGGSLLFSLISRVIDTLLPLRITFILTGVTAAQLQWHLSNMDVIQGIKLYFCQIEIVCNREIINKNLSLERKFMIEHQIITWGLIRGFFWQINISDVFLLLRY